jgi:hypothetical protein
MKKTIPSNYYVLKRLLAKKIDLHVENLKAKELFSLVKCLFSSIYLYHIIKSFFIHN